MEIKLYVEGGGRGTNKNATIKLQQGFDSLLKELKELARAKKISFKVIPSGSTDETYEEFIFSIKHSSQSFNLLLVDSDKPLEDKDTPKIFLQREKKWDLKKVEENQCHLMVQIMESWFLADSETLKSFYGQKFNSNAIPKTKDIEKILKDSVESSLDSATKNTQKGIYSENKLKHSSELLAKLSVEIIKVRAKHCQ